MNAREITSALKGRWHTTYGMVRCVAHEDKSPSLRLRDGDNGCLLVKCFAGCPSTSVLDEFRRRNMIGGTSSDRTDTADEVRKRRALEETKQAKRASDVEEVKRGCQAVAGTIAESYLRRRGITLSIPPSLRFHPRLRHPETRAFHSALVGFVQGPDRRVIGVHRTPLVPPGVKAPTGPDGNTKFSLGPIGGGGVRLAAASEEMAVSEGIETGLSFMQIYDIPTWSALSTAGLEAIILPPVPTARIVHIAMDIDVKRGGEKSARKAAERFEREGREVRFDRPSIGHKDFNDMLVSQ